MLRQDPDDREIRSVRELGEFTQPQIVFGIDVRGTFLRARFLTGDQVESWRDLDWAAGVGSQGVE
jgi:hypothetical protein